MNENSKFKLVHAIQEEFALKYLDTPMMSHCVICSMCGGNEGYAILIDPKHSDERMWFCSKPICLASIKRSIHETSKNIPNNKRSLEWALFCEINGIGDLYHDVKFEKLEQNTAKVEYLLKFATNPQGMILMQGDPGTGKTYASMAVCELFTRSNSSVIFCTQNKIQSKWLDNEKFKYVSSLEICNLLVIDDFGTGEVTTGFMKFFLDLINTRMQWKNRGTIISTNLNDKDFAVYCGEALNDRIKTGQKFEFKGKSRRKKLVI